MTVSIRIRPNEKLFLKDPELSELGRKIVNQSVELIDLLGFEKFTFKKLAQKINSTEASIYRYFENKHKLLVYLISWYWAWVEFQIDFKTNSIADADERLKVVINIIAESYKYDPSISHIDESLLHNIVVAESAKAYLTKNVDKENREGYFTHYKSICKKVASFIQDVNPNYPYPKALASNLIETAHEQIFFAEHIPSLTDLSIDKGDYGDIEAFLQHIIFKLIR